MQNPNIRPACLPENDDNDYAGYPAIVSGWGTTESGGEVSPFLQFVDVNVLSNTECTGPSYGYGSDQITDQMLCANVEGGGKDSCQGDSGMLRLTGEINKICFALVFSFLSGIFGGGLASFEAIL